MTRAPRYATIALLVTALAACTGSEIPGQRGQIAGTYQCDGDKSFSFTTTRGSEDITLVVDGQSHQLHQTPALSGDLQFSDGTLTVWTRSAGRFAILEGTAEPYSNCQASEWETGGVIQ